LVALEVVSTQEPLQAEVPVGQLEVHIEPPHNGLSAPHTTPHAPQFAGSEVRFLQTPLHSVVHTGAAPAAALPLPAPGVLVLPPAPPPPVTWSGELAEQLITSTAGSASVSSAPTYCARYEPDFSRNRFHIRTPNLKKVRRLRRRTTLAHIGFFHSAPTVARQSRSESADKSTLSLQLPSGRLISRLDSDKKPS
jgi:hypothetical protein